MDPASILGLITTAGTIATTITKTIRELSDLRAQYTDANVRIRLLIKELSTIKSSCTQINDWAHFLDDTHNQAELRDALQVALDGVELAMGALAEEVEALVQDTSASANVDLSFRAKTKYAWNEQNMREHENRLRAQVSALQLLLQASQCASRPEQAEFLRAPQNRRIIQKVAEDSITLRASMSTAGSRRGPPTITTNEDFTTEDKVFDWDDDIVNAATYRRALHHHISKRSIDAHENPQIHQEDLQSVAGSENKDYLSSASSPRPSREGRPLPYENSIVSEPVVQHGPGRNEYLQVSSRSDVAADRHHLFPHRLKSTDSVKNFWSSLNPKRSNRNMTPPTPATGPSSSPSPGSHHRGKRGFENSSYASIDFSSERGLSAPSIVRAAQAGSVVEVEMLLNQGADLSAIHRQSGRNALAVASQDGICSLFSIRLSITNFLMNSCGNENVVRLLLQYNADVNTRDASSYCPLHLAAMRGHYGVVEQLLQEHARVDELGPNDETPLRIASDKGYVEVADLLLRSRAKVNARDRKQMSTPLHKAAANGDEAMVDLLIRHGAHTEAKDGELMTPLHYACENGKDRVVSLLLNKKAGVESLGRRGMTPLVCAAASGQVLVLEVLLRKKASLKHQGEGDMTALHWASYNGHYEAVDHLLGKRAPLQAANKDGRTALHLAVMAGYFAVAELLLRKGAAVEAQCRAMNRPIHYACMEGKPEIVQLLLAYNANVEVESSGRRPLHYAAARGLTPIATVLLTRGVDIEARDSAGDRALGIASRMGHLEIMRMLLDRGSRLRSKFAKGPSHEDSPLCLAARGGHVAVVQELISRGTSVLQKDEQNWSPLRYASYYAHPQVVEFLLKAGATVSNNTAGHWGFDITARRIGFANEVHQEEQRKSQVLKLLTEAEAREAKARQATSAKPDRSPAREPGEGPTELAYDPAVARMSLESQPQKHSTSNGNKEQSHPSELDTAESPRSPPTTTTPSTAPYDPNPVYPSPSHIANTFGFDPYPQQRQQYSGATVSDADEGASTRPVSYDYSSNASASGSGVHIGPDGLWRLNPTTTSTHGKDEGASIYEMGS
ncbi:MAG: hypothetical protein Q9166_003992 [cf. Caloplaca sp. 2 TL-2023]